MHRSSPGAFAQDGLGQEATLAAVAAGHDTKLDAGMEKRKGGIQGEGPTTEARVLVLIGVLTSLSRGGEGGHYLYWDGTSSRGCLAESRFPCQLVELKQQS
jgi:hypothetical protein